MKEFTLVAIGCKAEAWNVCQSEIQTILKDSKFHIQIETGLWVFQNENGYSAALDLIVCLKNNGVAFVALPFDNPLPIGLSLPTGEPHASVSNSDDIGLKFLPLKPKAR
jgi:hypothetical protein